MKKLIIHILACFIPSSKYRKKFRNYCLKQKKIIICAGFGQSGNSCVRDFFKEFNNVFVNDLEDWLIKYQGGVLDLRNTLLHNNNYYTSDAAIKSFLKLVNYYGIYYQDMYKNNLLPLTNQFISQLINTCYCVPSKPFNWHISIFGDTDDISKKIFVAKRFTERKLDKIISKYLMRLYNAATDRPYIVLVNSIQNGNVIESLKIFRNAKVITCKRDLRDVYLDFKHNAQGSFIPTDSVYNIEQYFASVFYKYPVKNKHVLNIDFEDFVINYDKVSNKLLKFIGINKKKQKSKCKIFDPQKSINNIGIWRKYTDDPIVSELGAFQIKLFSKKWQLYRNVMYLLSLVSIRKNDKQYFSKQARLIK